MPEPALTRSIFRRSLVVAFALALPAALSSPAAAADQPPQTLHQVGDHWTAWDPPEIPAGTPDVYIIAAGDTLWGLAQRFYSDPYLWPQLWERNQYILDAHWIYPGDPLVTGAPAPTVVGDVGAADGAVVGADGELEDSTVTAAPGVEETEVAAAPLDELQILDADTAAGAPEALGAEDDIYCMGYLGDVDEEFAVSIVGSEYESLGGQYVRVPNTQLTVGADTEFAVKYNLYLSDLVYLDGGRAAGIEPGQLYTAIQPGETVRHPNTDAEIGRFHQYLGRVRVLTVQESTAIGEIVHSCYPIAVGMKMRLFEPEPVPLARRTEMRPPTAPVERSTLDAAPAIVWSDGGRFTLGEDHVVYIDRGAAEDVTPGDIYTVYRLGRGNTPPLVLGEIAVLSVQEHSALARIIHSRYTIHLGDVLSRK